MPLFEVRNTCGDTITLPYPYRGMLHQGQVAFVTANSKADLFTAFGGTEGTDRIVRVNPAGSSARPTSHDAESLEDILDGQGYQGQVFLMIEDLIRQHTGTLGAALTAELLAVIRRQDFSGKQTGWMGAALMAEIYAILKRQEQDERKPAWMGSALMAEIYALVKQAEKDEKHPAWMGSALMAEIYSILKRQEQDERKPAWMGSALMGQLHDLRKQVELEDDLVSQLGSALHGEVESLNRRMGMVLMGQVSTADATATNILTYIPRDGEAVRIVVEILGKKADGSQVGCYRLSALARRSGAATTLVNDGTIEVYEDDVNWDVDVIVDLGDATQLDFQVIGVAATDITWVAKAYVTSL